MSDTLITADANKRMFDKIASRYDLTNRIISLGLDRRWRTKAVSLLKPDADKSYLDVGCGTGDVMLEILMQSPESKVYGIDPAENMLDIARNKFLKSRCSRMKLVNADACQLPIKNEYFHGVISAFCFRNISDRRKALSEVHRVLRLGGRFVLLELTVSDRKLLTPFYWLYSRLIIPVAGLLTGNRKAYRYLIDSIYDFSTNEDIESLMKDCGFTNIHAYRLNFGVITIFVGQRT